MALLFPRFLEFLEVVVFVVVLDEDHLKVDGDGGITAGERELEGRVLAELADAGAVGHALTFALTLALE